MDVSLENCSSPKFTHGIRSTPECYMCKTLSVTTDCKGCGKYICIDHIQEINEDGCMCESCVVINSKKKKQICSYVAGPIRGDSMWDVEQNIRRVESLALQLWKYGNAVHICLDGDLELMRRMDRVCVVCGVLQ